MAVGWNKVNGVFVSREKAIAAGLTPPPPRSRSRAPDPPPPAPNGAGWPADMHNPNPGGKVLQFAARPTLDQALEATRTPPAPIATDETSNGPTPISAAVPPAPVVVTVGAPTDEPESFAALAGKLTTSGSVAVCGMILRKRGFEPRDPDEDDTERLERAYAKAIRKSIGDRPIPLWMEIACGTALLYMSMGNGAPKREPEPEAADTGPGPGEQPEAKPITEPPAAPRPFGVPTSKGGRIVTDRPPPVDVGPRAA